MSKVSTYKLALLGCVSSCLMNVAFASPNDDVIRFITKHHNLNDTTCNAEPRFVSYWIKNFGDDKFTVTSMHLDTNYSRDDFYDVDDIVTLPAPTREDHHACGFDVAGRVPFELKAGHTCEIVVKIDPENSIACPAGLPYPPLGEIDRKVIVHYNGPERETEARINFDFTYLGSADGFSLVGNNIFNDAHIEEAALESEKAGVIQLFQDVAITNPRGHLTKDIAYGDDSRAFRFGSTVLNVFNDMQAAFNNLSVVTNECQTTNGLPHTLNDDHHVTDQLKIKETTTFCLANGQTPPLKIDGTVTFTNENLKDHKAPYWIIVADHPDAYALWIEQGSNYHIDNSKAHGEHATEDNIIWIVDGNIEGEVNSQVPGSFLINGYFETDNDFGTPLQVVGRVLALDKDISLHGNNIAKPHEHQ